MGKGGIITGIICIILGVGIIIASIFSTWVFLIHGGILLAIGIGLVVFNREEDKIEKIKSED